MALLREDPALLRAAFNNASDALNGLEVTFIEKDYWVTQVLRELHACYPGGFLFNGGTSLSKGYGIIERFSEDVDILVVRRAGASNRDSEMHLQTMAVTVAGALGLTRTEHRTPGRGREPNRADDLGYTAVTTSGIRVAVRPDVVLLETGYSGGTEPAEMVEVSPLVGAALELDPAEFADIAPFTVRALEPRRTLIEKLFALHHIASCWMTGDVHDEERFGRHYYDVYKLLEHASTMKKLADRTGFEVLVTEVERVSGLHFGGTTARPSAGFATSPAFTPVDPELRGWLEVKFADGLELVPRTKERPSFGRVLQRVGQNAHLL
ncbi:MAG: nucleotidyl transferase AbiEii/AbiGii toxin family protein [Acidimicrobiales bacterium]